MLFWHGGFKGFHPIQYMSCVAILSPYLVTTNSVNDRSPEEHFPLLPQWTICLPWISPTIEGIELPLLTSPFVFHGFENFPVFEHSWVVHAKDFLLPFNEAMVKSFCLFKLPLIDKCGDQELKCCDRVTVVWTQKLLLGFEEATEKPFHPFKLPQLEHHVGEIAKCCERVTVVWTQKLLLGFEEATGEPFHLFKLPLTENCDGEELKCCECVTVVWTQKLVS